MSDLQQRRTVKWMLLGDRVDARVFQVALLANFIGWSAMGALIWLAAQPFLELGAWPFPLVAAAAVGIPVIGSTSAALVVAQTCDIRRRP